MAPALPSVRGSRLTLPCLRAAALGFAALAVSSCSLRPTFCASARGAQLRLPALHGFSARVGVAAKAAEGSATMLDGETMLAGEVWGLARDESTDESVDYVQEVRSLLKRDGAVARHQWKLFSDRYAGELPPRRVPREKLKTFLEHYHTGYRQVSSATSLRDLMEHSPAIKEAWQEVVQSQKDFNWDFEPTSYSKAFVDKFLKSLVVDASTVPPRVMLARKTKLLIEAGGFESEWEDHVKNSGSGESLQPDDHSNDVLEEFLKQFDPDLLDAERGDLIYAVENFFGSDPDGADPWVDYIASVRAEQGLESPEEFPDPRDSKLEELEEFLKSVTGRMQKTNMAGWSKPRQFGFD